MRHFEFYPQIEYSGQTAVNMMLRAKLRDEVKANNVLYYDYTIKDGKRADIIATRYYGTPDYTWAIFYANDIICPHEQWPLFEREFNRFITKKYGNPFIAQITPHHYLLDDKYIIDEATFNDLNIEAKRKRMVSNWDYEVDVNDKKRDIIVIDVVYLRQIINEIESIFL